MTYHGTLKLTITLDVTAPLPAATYPALALDRFAVVFPRSNDRAHLISVTQTAGYAVSAPALCGVDPRGALAPLRTADPRPHWQRAARIDPLERLCPACDIVAAYVSQPRGAV